MSDEAAERAAREIANRLGRTGDPEASYVLSIIRREIDRAVAEEREACAAGVRVANHLPACRCRRCREYARIAAAIRARGK